jgi:general secretion pathway protein N
MGASCSFAPLGTHAAAPASTAVQADDTAVQPVGAPPSSGNPLWGVPFNSLTATRERPIFSPSRRPPLVIPPAPVAMPSTPPPAPAAPEEIPLKLVGTIIGRDSAIAICFNPSTREVIRLKTGENFEGWVLRAVHGREAAFEKATLQAQLSLPSPEDQGAPPLQFQTPVAAPPPPRQPAVPLNTPSGTWKDGDGQLIAAPPKTR